jgi:hypothetical protein
MQRVKANKSRQVLVGAASSLKKFKEAVEIHEAYICLFFADQSGFYKKTISKPVDTSE